MSDLKSQLAAAGFDVSRLKTLREVAVEGDDDLASIEESDLEQQFPIYTLPTKTQETLSIWKRLKAISAKIGHYPVILGDKQSIGLHWEHREDAEYPEEGLAVAQGYRVKEWLDNQWTAMFRPGYFVTPLKEENLRGEWPQNVSPMPTFDVSRMYWKTPTICYIGFLETSENWELPVYLPFGNWNDCHRPEIHAAIHRYWQGKYETEIVAMLFDTLVCRVGQPVTTSEAALELAREHMAYCPDNLLQASLTLDSYAAHLIDSIYWGFWWD